jgi:hypothetical protein
MQRGLKLQMNEVAVSEPCIPIKMQLHQHALVCVLFIAEVGLAEGI